MTREELIPLIKWRLPERPKGGQHTNGPQDPTVTLECDVYEFTLTICMYRSQLRNKELALTLLELAIETSGKHEM